MLAAQEHARRANVLSGDLGCRELATYVMLESNSESGNKIAVGDPEMRVRALYVSTLRHKTNHLVSCVRRPSARIGYDFPFRFESRRGPPLDGFVALYQGSSLVI